MSDRILLMYLNKNKVKCFRVLEESRISDEITTVADPEVFNCEAYNTCKLKNIVIHRTKPGTSDVLDFNRDVSDDCWMLDMTKYKTNTVSYKYGWEFVKDCTDTDLVNQCYNLLMDVLKVLEMKI